MSQKDDILRHLQNGNPISQWEAIEIFRCTRLSAIIFALKEAGYKFDSKWKSYKKKRYMEYKLNTKGQLEMFNK